MAGYQSVIQLTPRHYKILDFAIAGLNASSIAERLSMSRGQVSLILASPSFQHQFAIRRQAEEDSQANSNASHIDEVKEELQSSALAAAKKLISGLDSVDEKISMKSATELLDRTGYPKEQHISADMSNQTQIIIGKDEFDVLNESLNIDEELTPEQDKKEQVEAGTTDKELLTVASPT